MNFNRFTIAAGLVLTATGSMIAGAATAAPESTPSTSVVGSEHIAAKTGFPAGPFIGNYNIRIHTANVKWAGTDGDVYLRVNGTRGSTGYWRLDTPGVDDYEKDNINTFKREGPYVGWLRSIRICLRPLGGDNAEWLPDWVTVNGVVFPRHWNKSWFPKTEDSCKTFSR